MRWVLSFLLIFSAPAAASLQTDFNAAQTAYEAEHWNEARTLFTAVLERLSSSQTHTAALIAARLGVAEARVNNPDAAIPRLEMAVKALNSPADTKDRVEARLELANAYEAAVNMSAAAREYSAVTAELDVANGAYGLAARIGLVRSLLFADPVTARAEFDALLPAAVIAFAKQPAELAELYNLRGRIELNDRKLNLARMWFLKALPLTGGMSLKVTVPAQRVRGNLALVSHFLGNEDDARRYLAFTGTGRLPKGGFGLNAEIARPACTPLTDLKPDDVAVIEINIGADGRVANASTVYASRSGGPDTAFAAAARNWWWAPDAVSKLPPFWRQAVRLEVRCYSTRPRTELGWNLFQREFEAWYTAAKIEPLPEFPDNEAAAKAAFAAEVKRREAKYGTMSPQLFPLILHQPWMGTIEDRTTFARMLALSKAGGAPPDILIALESGTTFRVLPADKPQRPTDVAAAAVPLLARLVADAVAGGNGDTRGTAFVRAHLGIEREKLRDYKGAAAAFQEVIATSPAVLPESDPIRQIALLRLASLAAARRDLDQAAELYQKTGLNPDQCSLVDVRPLPVRVSVGQRDFPSEAKAWSFEGYVRVAFDITADGRPSNARAVTAMPPFVFSAGTVKTAGNFRFRPIYRGGVATGCSGYSSAVKYQIAG